MAKKRESNEKERAAIVAEAIHLSYRQVATKCGCNPRFLRQLSPAQGEEDPVQGQECTGHMAGVSSSCRAHAFVLRLSPNAVIFCPISQPVSAIINLQYTTCSPSPQKYAPRLHSEEMLADPVKLQLSKRTTCSSPGGV